LIKNENSRQTASPLKVLIYGYGNPGRQDDALGVFLAEYIGQWARENHLSNIETDQNYQLNIEDAERIACFDLVIFCDASVKEIEHAELEEVIPDLRTDFSMHAVSPSFVVGLCQRIFNRNPKAYQLHIKGYSWEFMQNLTKGAARNLKKAQKLLTSKLLAEVKG
jgi:hydrogenase maturation protease